MSELEDTRVKMARLLLENVECARAAMEDGRSGYVFHTADFTLFLCEHDGILRLGSPLSENMVVSADPDTMQRHWNSRLSYDQIDCGCGVISSLRREALTGFIDVQKALLEMLVRPASDALELH